MASADLEKNGNRGYANGGGPVQYETDRSWTSWLIPFFVVVNVAMFFVVMFVNNCPKNNVGFEGECVARFLGRLSFQPLKENPLFGPSSSTLLKMGALQWDRVVHEHQGWRLVSSMWLHAGVIHILANMLSLVVIGIRLEQQFGFCKLFFYQLIHILGF
ncbi:hypothetical protein V2J09_020258 [Rumex salicifolius]